MKEIKGFITWIRTFLDDVYVEKGSGSDITVDDALSSTSENPVQNKVINSALSGKANSTHNHGSITNAGALTSGSTTITANNDYILYADRDNSTANIIRGTTRVNNELIVDTTAHSNIGTSANAKQSAINTAIDTKLGQVATLDKVYPVGSIYMSVNSTNPSTLFGGTWVQIGQGRTLIGQGTGTDSNNTSKTFANGETSGEYAHTLATTEMPSHTHSPPTWVHYASSGGNTGGYNLPTVSNNRGNTYVQASPQVNKDVGYTGGGQAHNNMPPYLVVYMWKRTA